MLATSMLLTTIPALLPILLCWLFGAAIIAAICLFNRARIRRHDSSV